MKKKITFQEAFKVFSSHLRNDDALYISYQANIAMAFSDKLSQAGYKLPDQHKICNDAATYFLSLLLSEPGKKFKLRALKKTYKLQEAPLFVGWEPAPKLPPLPGGIEDVIEDGFGSVWSAWCPTCKRKSMEIVRPGKVQCGHCG